MENKAHALTAGLFVVAILALLVAMAIWLTRDVGTTRPYEMITADSVTGLRVQAPVRFKGVPVGTVTAINFNPAQRSSVLIQMAIAEDAPITRATFATLAFQGVTGLSFVQLDDHGTSAQPLPPGPDGGPPRIPLRPNVLGQLSDQVGALTTKVDSAIASVNQLLSPENQAAVMATVKEFGVAATQASQFARTADQTLRAQFGSDRTNIPELVRQTHATLKATAATAAAAQKTLTELDGVLTSARTGVQRVTGPGGTLDQVNGGVDTVTQSTLPRIQRLTTGATQTVQRLDRLVGTLDSNPQALVYGNGVTPPGPGEPGFVAPVSH